VINEMSWSWQHAEGDAPIGRGEIPSINVPGIVSYGQGFSDAVFIQNNQQWRNVTTWSFYILSHGFAARKSKT